jgi:hypothetical protein
LSTFISIKLWQFSGRNFEVKKSLSSSQPFNVKTPSQKVNSIERQKRGDIQMRLHGTEAQKRKHCMDQS